MDSDKTARLFWAGVGGIGGPGIARAFVPIGRGMARAVLVCMVLIVVSLFFCPSGLNAQTCLGLSPEPNSGGLEIGLGHQGDGQRVGLWANVNIADRVGLLAGAGWGTIDSFADGGYEVRGLIAFPIFKGYTNVCVFGEYEQAHETFQKALGMTHGEITDYWFHFGYAVGGELARAAGFDFTLQVAPEVILRRTHYRGRKTYTEPDLHVLETIRVWGDWYLGGRAMISARHSRFHLTWGVQNRPRRWSDLHWFFRLGFPL